MQFLEFLTAGITSTKHQRPPPPQSTERTMRIEKRDASQLQENIKMENERGTAYMFVAAEEELPQNNEEVAEEEMEPQPKFTDIGVQVGQQAKMVKYTAPSLSAEGMLHYYTGLESYDKFKLVFHSLGPAVYELNYYHVGHPPVPLEDQLLITLMKLRRHTPHQELSFMFGIGQKQVTNIFITWINFMNCQWGEIDFWPVKELVNFYTPSDFALKFPKTRVPVILDGAECPIQKPTCAVAQQATFSTYKNRNTVKTVVGGTPGGLVSYVSPAYGGSASDRQIIERSDMVKMCDAGDELMVDKGFNVDDIFIPFQMHVNIPTFFKKKNRMSCVSVAKDRKIASKRVHIERLIGLGKTYKILTEPMTPVESSLATQIIKVVFALCNFRTCIVPTDA